MKRIAACLLFLPLAIISCKNAKDKREMLIGTWRTVKVENKDVDEFFVNGQKYIDTIGKNNDNATNIALYGVSNMDSLRQILQLQFDSVKNLQMTQSTQTVFRFGRDSTITLEIPGRTDKGKWYLDKDGAIVLDENSDGPGATTKANILTLNDTALKLMFIKSDSGLNDTSYVSFHREGK